jgi:ectoine hydroxylase-related dioxygenase (phytanoyl-CoA dioxygenase family)
LIRPGVFSVAEVETLRQAVARACATAIAQVDSGVRYHLDGKIFVDIGACTVQYEHATDSNTLRVVEPVTLLDQTLDSLSDDPRLVNPMRSIIGQQTLSLWTAKLNLKSPGGSGFGWHQDSPYWIHDSNHVDLLPNVMITLDKQSKENGCFEVIQASHRHGILHGTDNGTQLGGFFTDPAAFDERNSIKVEAPAGSLIFFDPHCVHGSSPNNSNLHRRALIYTYQPGGHPMLKTGSHRPVGIVSA